MKGSRSFILWIFVIDCYISTASGAYELLLSCGKNVASGSDCAMTCDTKTTTVTIIQWLNGTSPTTIDKNVDCTDAGGLPYESSCNTLGKYDLKITNAQYGRDSYAWSCTSPFGGGVQSNATDGDTFVTVPLTRVTLTRPTATSISCVAVSSPAANVTLYEGSPPSQNIVVKTEKSFTKTMNGLETRLTSTVEDSKTYYCHADNGVGGGVGSRTSVPDAVPRIEMDRRKAVVNLPLTITCTSEVTITTTVTFFIKPAVLKGGCLASGTCGSSFARYSVTQNRAERTTSLTISSVDPIADNGTWFCSQEGEGYSGHLPITQFATLLNWSSVRFIPSVLSLPSSVTPKQIIKINVATPCIEPQASFNWRYQQGVSGSPPSNTSTSQTSCPSGQVQTINTLSLPGNTPSLFNKQISLTVSVEHDSFDPPTYTRSATCSSIQFPVPVTSVTMQELGSDNEKVGQRLGTELTLTCVTSASFPTSTVIWSGLPSGTTPTSTSTSGLLKTTTSSMTFTLSKSDEGRTVRCTASNIEGQTSPQSNRAVLEVQYGPDANQVGLTKTPDVVAVEGRTLTLTCSTLTSVSPGVTFTFTYSNGSPASGGVPGSVTVSAGNKWSQSLTFQPIRDKRTVQCTVRNTATGVQESQTIVLDVKYAAPRIEMDRRKAVVNLPLTITCTSEVTITTTVTFFIKPAVSKGACLASGTCGSAYSRYSVTQNRAQRTTTLTISSVDSTADTGTWFCIQEGEGDSGDLTITQFATVFDWSSVSFTPSLSSLPSSVTPQQRVTVTVTTPCAAPQASFNWRYQQGVSGSPPSSTSTSQTSCPSDQFQTINTLSLSGNTQSLFNRTIFLTVSVEHDSFDPPPYTRSATSNSIQFTVPVINVTMQEINSDNEKVGQRLGTDLTLTCVTSASFPTSTVSWSGLPFRTTPTSTSTSGLLKTTTSSVTFTLSKSDQGRTVRCTASNIDGQTSPQSNRAVLEVQYAPVISSSFPINVDVTENSSLNIDCNIGLSTGNPSDTSYTWTGPGGYSKSGSVLDRRVSRSQGGSYTCTARNSAGLSDSAQDNINVQTSPFPPTNVHATSVGPTSLSVKWTSNDNGGATQMFHLEFQSYTNNWVNTLTNEIPDPAKDSTVSTDVTGLQPSTRYGFTIFSTNVYGSSQKVELNVTTAEASNTEVDCFTASTCSTAGLITSVVINVFLLAVLVLFLILVLLYRRKESRYRKRDAIDTDHTSTGVVPTPTANPYSELDHTSSDKQTYSELKAAEYEEARISS